MKLDHTGLSVPDLEQAVEFFTSCFGAREVFRLPRIDGGMDRLGADPQAAFALAMLEIGGGRVELIQWWTPREAGAIPAADAAGGVHLGIEVDNVTVTLAALESVHGVTILGKPVTFHEGPTPGLTNAFLTTPWGALIELVNWGSP